MTDVGPITGASRWEDLLPLSKKTGEKRSISAALKVLSSKVEKNESFYTKKKKDIEDLNKILQDIDVLQKEFGLDEREARKIHGMSITVPRRKSKRVLGSVAKVLKGTAGVVAEIGNAVVPKRFRAFASLPDPEGVKTYAPPILLIHGFASGEQKWNTWKKALYKEEYGSVFTIDLNADTDKAKEEGIGAYAEEVQKKCVEIAAATQQKEIVLIGHSMGGLVAADTAEKMEKAGSEVKVSHVITIATPWRGSSVLSKAPSSVRRRIAKNDKRLEDMTPGSDCLRDLRQRVRDSEEKGRRQYHTIGSDVDTVVSSVKSTLSIDPRHKKKISLVGHSSITSALDTWIHVWSWLDPYYHGIQQKR